MGYAYSRVLDNQLKDSVKKSKVAQIPWKQGELVQVVLEYREIRNMRQLGDTKVLLFRDQDGWLVYVRAHEFDTSLLTLKFRDVIMIEGRIGKIRYDGYTLVQAKRFL
jgi:hypothetical protein